MNIVLKSLVALKDFMLLLILFIFIFIVLGTQLFGGNPYYTAANTDTWRKGFATFYESFYTVFESLTGESWTGNIWNSMAAVGPAACLYWIAWDVVGHKVLLNLFLAILINNFQDAEDEPEDDMDMELLSPHSPALNQIMPSPGNADQRSFPHSRQASQEALEAGGLGRRSRASAEAYPSPPPLGRRGSFVDGLRGFMAPGSSTMLDTRGGRRRSSAEGAPAKPPALGAAAKHGSFFMGKAPGVGGGTTEHVGNFTRLVRGQAPQPGAFHNVLRMRRWLVSLDSMYGVKAWEVVKSQMDQEAEVMKQSMARQESLSQLQKEEEEAASPVKATSPTSKQAASGNRPSLFAGFSKKRFMMPVPFSPFRTKSRGFDPYAETPHSQSEAKSPPSSPPGGTGGSPQDEHDLKPPEPPQLVLPSLLSRRMSSIVPAHTLSRFHAATGPGDTEAEVSNGLISETPNQEPPTNESIDMSGMDSVSGAAVKKSARDDAGLRHVHIAGVTEQGPHHNGESDLWASMLRKKIGADPELAYRAGSETSEEDARMSRVGSEAALLGADQISSSGFNISHTPNHHMAHPATSALHHHQGTLQQPSAQQPFPEQPSAQQPLAEQAQAPSGFQRLGRLLLHTAHLAPHPASQPAQHQFSHSDPQLPGGSPQQVPEKSLWQRVGQSTRIMTAFKKKNSQGAEGLQGMGVSPAGQGLQTAASDFPLLPAGLPYDEVSQPGQQHASGEQQQAASDMQAEQENLVPAGFAGTVVQAYMSLNYVSLGVFSGDNKLRLLCLRIITNAYFEGVILLLVLFSSILLALDAPSLRPHSTLDNVINTCDLLFVACFALEMCMKVIALGLFAHPSSYLRSPWNQLDAVVVITSLVSSGAPNSHISILRALRLLRVLRPLRMISRFRGMQVVVLALIRSIPPIASVAMFGLFEFIVFAIIGVQLFSGRLGACNQVEIDGVAVQYKSQCIQGISFVCNGTQDNNCNDGDVTIRQWQVAFYNFDNMASALLSVVEVGVMDNYMDDVAYQLMDAVGVDRQPQLWHNPWAGLYVVSVCFFIGLFWVNLLQGAIIDNYCRLIEEMGGNLMLTDEQKKWLDVLRLKGSEKKRQEEIDNIANPVRRVCYKMVIHRYFDPAIMGIILVNMAIICMTYRGESAEYSRALSDLNNWFVSSYVAEAVLKNLAFGPWAYIKDNWNKLDLIIATLALIDVFVTSDKMDGISSVLRIARVARLLKLLQSAKGLRTLFNTLISSLPAVFNVGSLLFLMFFIYAILGMNLFGTASNELSQQDPHANFLSFGASMLTLFRLSTSDSWDQILQSSQGCPIFNVACDSGSKGVVSAIYCISFIFGVNFIMLNLVIAVIIDQFVESAGREGLFLDNTLFEILHKKMLLDRFLKRLRTKVRNYQETQQLANKKAKRGRRKSILLFGANKNRNDEEDSNNSKKATDAGSQKAATQPSLGRGISTFDPAYLASMFRSPSQHIDAEAPKEGLVLSRGGSAVGTPQLRRDRSYAKTRSYE